MSTVTQPVPGNPTDPTSLETDVLNSNNAMIVNCAATNAANQAHYDQAGENYNLNALSGQKHDPPLVPPTAPKSWIVLPPDANGYQWYAQTGPALTPTPPLKIDAVDLGTLTVPVPLHNHLSIDWDAWRPNTKWVPANKDDGWPNELITPPQTAPDGTVHTYERFSTPFGALYLAVS